MAAGDGQLDSQAGPFQIKVLEGELSVADLTDADDRGVRTGATPGVIHLGGRAGPFRPFTVQGTHRANTKFYPGNPGGSQQALGPAEEPSTFSGEWNDRYLGDGAAMALLGVLDDLRVRGVSLEVSWGGSLTASSAAGTAIVRVGIITRAKFTVDRVQDVQWELTFEWRSRGDSAAPVAAATAQLNPRQDVADAVDDLQLSSAMWDAWSEGPAGDIGFPQQIADAMGQAQGAIETAVEAIRSGQSEIQQASVIPAQAALRIIGAAQDGMASLVLMESTLLSLPLLAMEVRDSALDLLGMRCDIYDQLDQAGAARERCAAVRDGVAALVEPDVIAVVQAPPGTSLYDLAYTYLGDPDLAWAIANFNDIDGMVVPDPPTGPSDVPSRPLYIPRVQPGSSSSDLRAAC